MDRYIERRLHFISHVVHLMVIVVALLLFTNVARSESPQPAPKVGEEYEISKKYETSQ
jgi:hypothetical protein